MKKFIWRTAAFAFPVLMIMIGINGTAAYIKSRGVTERRMADNIAQGYYVTNLAKYDDRLFQKFLIERMDSLPEEIVLGSSRSMQITHQFAVYDKFYNSSLFGAYVDEIAAVYDLYERRGAPLKRVVIGIDPWIFRGDRDREYMTLEQEYKEISARLQVSVLRRSSCWRYVDRLISPSRIGESLRFLAQVIRPDSELFVATLDSLNTGATEYSDGSYSVTEAERKVSREELTVFDVNRHLGHNFTHLSEDEQRFFKKFVLYLKNKGIEVVLVFAPYHPVVWDYVPQADSMVIKTERVVRKFAEENGIEVIGTYDPSVYGLDVTAFINGGHPKKEVFEYLFSENSPGNPNF